MSAVKQWMIHELGYGSYDVVPLNHIDADCLDEVAVVLRADFDLQVGCGMKLVEQNEALRVRLAETELDLVDAQTKEIERLSAALRSHKDFHCTCGFAVDHALAAIAELVEQKS